MADRVRLVRLNQDVERLVSEAPAVGGSSIDWQLTTGAMLDSLDEMRSTITTQLDSRERAKLTSAAGWLRKNVAGTYQGNDRDTAIAQLRELQTVVQDATSRMAMVTAALQPAAPQLSGALTLETSRPSAAAEAPAAAGEATFIGEWHVTGTELGSGGQGRVELVEHRATGVLGALKRLGGSRKVTEKSVERFRREIDAVKKLKHPSYATRAVRLRARARARAMRRTRRGGATRGAPGPRPRRRENTDRSERRRRERAGLAASRRPASPSTSHPPPCTARSVTTRRRVPRAQWAAAAANGRSPQRPIVAVVFSPGRVSRSAPRLESWPPLIDPAATITSPRMAPEILLGARATSPVTPMPMRPLPTTPAAPVASTRVASTYGT